MSGSDRILAAAAVGLALLVAAMASQYTVRFLVDPLGPRALPYLVAGLLAVSGAALLLRRPGSGSPEGGASDAAEPSVQPAGPAGFSRIRRQIAGIAALSGYAIAIPWLGFMAATTLATAVLARLFGGGWGRGLLTGIVFAAALYALFSLGFGLQLPAGRLVALLPGMTGG
jgi:putative tricarboxylic transport membrane protein